MPGKADQVKRTQDAVIRNFKADLNQILEDLGLGGRILL
jgi:hypothetical protein